MNTSKEKRERIIRMIDLKLQQLVFPDDADPEEIRIMILYPHGVHTLNIDMQKDREEI